MRRFRGRVVRVEPLLSPAFQLPTRRCLAAAAAASAVTAATHTPLLERPLLVLPPAGLRRGVHHLLARDTVGGHLHPPSFDDTRAGRGRGARCDPSHVATPSPVNRAARTGLGCGPQTRVFSHEYLTYYSAGILDGRSSTGYQLAPSPAHADCAVGWGRALLLG